MLLVDWVKKRTTRAFTLMELLMVISIIAILASLLLVAIVSAKSKSKQATCLNNLHQLGLGFTAYTLDQEGKLPMDLPMSLGGSSEFNNAGLIENTTFSRDFHHFAALSNEVPNVRVMTCPADKKRRFAANYTSFSATNLSYFVNTRSVPHASSKILAGDWNIYNANTATNVENLAFGREVHHRRGSVLFGDGRVEITRTLAYAGDVHPLPDNTAVAVAPVRPTVPGRDRQTPPTLTRERPDRANQPVVVAADPSRPNPREPLPNASSQKTEPAATNLATAMNPAAARQPHQVRNPSVVEEIIPAASPPQSPSEEAPARRSKESTADSESEPWNTPGFRMFKAFALVSYLISLLWAIILLLILYLRSRMAQREQARATAISPD
jgi:prepilin-type N-terminal cleavage/methylation domain-containing protein